MSPEAIQAITWVAALLVVGVYVLFVVWRYRVDRRKKALQDEEASALSRSIARAAEATLPPRPAAAPVVTNVITNAPTPAPSPARQTDSGPPSVTTVAGALAGVVLPSDLVPLTTMAPRPNTLDRVAFWTDTAPVEIVGPAFTAELERLGYVVTTLDKESLAARREDVRLLVVVHPDGRLATIAGVQAFESVPEQSVVIEVWLPE